MNNITLPINESDNRFLTDYRPIKNLDTRISTVEKINNITDYKKYLKTYAKNNITDNITNKKLENEVKKLAFIKQIHII